MDILEKWKNLIEACKAYYIDSVPTGYTDSEYDEMERQAVQEDNFYVRDYVFQTYLKGVKTKNSYIEKIKKEKVTDSSMLDALIKVSEEVPDAFFDLKYDGSSIAVYIDPKTGVPKRVVTVGNLNIENFGIDQTWKLSKFLPKKFPKGIVAIQTEALIDITRLGSDIDPERARQKANGLINSKYCDSEVNNLLTLRAYRYYTDDSPAGLAIKNMIYKDVISSFETIYSEDDGHILFAPADIFTIEDLKKNSGYCETDRTITSTGTFLNDGWVVYDKHGNCVKAMKFAGAGSDTEKLIKTKVNSIQWNNQASKGKDSWSANVIIDPVTIKGVTIRKPSAGSVGKMVKKNITPGAEVSIVLANSTIPMVGECFSAGNGDFMWPTCSCGYKLSAKDIYGSNIKCGNIFCTERINRMNGYLKTLSNIKDIDWNKLLVLDRVKLDNSILTKTLLTFVIEDKPNNYYEFLKSQLSTDLQIKNLDLVWKASFKVLRDSFLSSFSINE